MSIEDRVRATARARTALVRDIRPLEFPDGRPAPARRARRWLRSGAPVAAAALVAAVALVLVMLRQAGGPPSGPAASVPASVPRYYAVLDHLGGVQAAGPASSTPQQVIVADDRTGRTLAVIPPSPGQTFSGVTAAADDRTFVLSSYQAAKRETTWYLLRITPGAAHPAKLTKLPIKPLLAQPTGLALSPDGRELAVMFRTASTAGNARTQLSVYSVSSGAALGAWRTDATDGGLIGGSANVDGLSWVNGDRSVTFRWATSVRGVQNSSELTVRTLDVTAAGHDLMADSRLVLQVPSSVARGGFFTDPCATSLVASDGRTVICSTIGAKAPSAACPAAPPWFVSYSTATGKPLQVLYRYQDPCVNGQALLLWTDPSGSHVIGVILLVKGKGASPPLFGLFAAGRLTPLPDLVVGTRYLQSDPDLLSGIAF